MIRNPAIVLAVALLASVLPVRGFEAYLKISSRKGDVATDPLHSWVEVLGFSHGVDVESTGISGGAGAGTGRVEPRSCTLTLGQDRSVADLTDALVKGEPRDLTLQLTRRVNERTTVLTEITFEDAYMESVAASAAEGDGVVGFAIRFYYSRLLWSVMVPDFKGGDAELAVGSGFDAVELRLIGRNSVTVPVAGDYAGAGPPADRDGDGMPDEWETANGLDPDNPYDALEDRDGDGFTNREEYLAGTDPNSGASFFQASVQGPGTAEPGAVVLRWNSVPGRRYTVLATRDLAVPFEPLAEVEGAAGTETRYETTLEAGRFFRVRVE